MIGRLFTFNICIEISCLLAATYFLYKDRNAFWKSGIFYLVLVCLTEIASRYMASFLHRPNGWLHNILLLFELVFINAMFYHFTRKYSRHAATVVIGMVLIVLGSYAVEWYVSEPYRFYNDTFTILSIQMVVLCLYYYYLFLKQEEFVALRYHPDFWFAAGVLLFYFGATVSNLLYEVMAIEMGYQTTLRGYIFNILIVLLYTCWAYSFLCRYRLRRKSHSSLL